MPGPVEVGREHAGGPRVNVEVLGGYGQVCGHFQVQSFDGRTHKAVILMAVVCHSKGTRVTVRKRKRCIEQSPGEARWGWGVAALAVLLSGVMWTVPASDNSCDSMGGSHANHQPHHGTAACIGHQRLSSATQPGDTL